MDYLVIGGLTLAGILITIGVWYSLMHGGIKDDDE